jgi:hypothetical protein
MHQSGEAAQATSERRMNNKRTRISKMEHVVNLLTIYHLESRYPKFKDILKQAIRTSVEALQILCIKYIAHFMNPKDYRLYINQSINQSIVRIISGRRDGIHITSADTLFFPLFFLSSVPHRYTLYNTRTNFRDSVIHYMTHTY